MGSKEIWDKVRDGFDAELQLSKYSAHNVKYGIRRFVYCLSRYKFVSKLLQGKDSCLELGCNDGFNTLVLADVVQSVTGVDFDVDSISYANKKLATESIRFIHRDIFDIGKIGTFGAVVSMDVIEHIEAQREDEFMEVMCANLDKHGIGIVGTPNIAASQYQSRASEIGHVNMYDHERLRKLMDKYFYNTFLFSANDETVHTGFYPMAHYFIAVGVSVK